jgi:glycosyltransferase involved in cell wall biosynthesis
VAHASDLRIVVTHPGRQHSHQAALALAGADMLAGYWAGVPSVGAHGRLVPRTLWRRYATLPLPADLVRCAPWTPALRRVGDRLPHALACRIDFFACRLFDRWAAARLASARPDAVIACEISALNTFRAAKRLGIATLLDAPSIHHLAQDRVQPTLDPPGLHRRIAKVKDAEIALADHVLTVSELALSTYLEAGVPSAKVHALPLGVDSRLFSPDSLESEIPPRRRVDPFVFLFAGATIRRKGFDLLLEAFSRAAARAPSARLRVVGPTGDAALPRSRTDGDIAIVGPLDQAALAEELRRADCLVLPSRHDSYGMVVAEALAAGTPVIVSTMVGAKDLIADGINGWVVPVEADALAARMIWCVEHGDQVRAMREECRHSARDATWEAYHSRLVGLLTSLLGSRLTRPDAAAAVTQGAIA